LGSSGLAYAGPKFVEGLKGRAIQRRSKRRLVLDLCVHVQLAWESCNFTGSSVPLLESLKSKAHLINDARNGKLDSSATSFAFQGF
jgi:hypothetical protein